MSSVSISYGAHKRGGAHLPELSLLNMLVEKTPTQIERPVVLRSRPGLEVLATLGTGALRGIGQRSGLLSGDAVIVSGTEVYRLSSAGVVTALTGSVDGNDLVRISLGRNADGDDRAWIASSTGLYVCDGSTVTEEDFPDATRPGCQDHEYHRGFRIAVPTDSEQAYYQVPGDTAWDALSFASAEYQPDKLVAIRTRGDQIYLFGSASTEVWYLTGQADPAIAPYGGLNFDFGCRARDSVVNIGSVILWVDDKCRVRLSEGGEARVISDYGLSEAIADTSADNLRGWGFVLDGHQIYVLTLSANATWAFDLTEERWCRLSSLDYDYWRAHLGADTGDKVLALDNLSNTVWRVAPERLTDGDDVFSREFTALVEVREGRVPCTNIELVCAVGGSPRTGQGSDPLVGLKYSDDGGQTWSQWKYRGLGQTGKYRTRPRWGPLGLIEAPSGRVLWFRITDPVVTRISDVRMNAP